MGIFYKLKQVHIFFKIWTNKLFLYYFSEIGQAFNMLGKDPDCRVIILSGNGKAFCSGIDLSDLMELGNVVNSDEDTARKSMRMLNVIKTFQSYFMAMEKVRKILRNYPVQNHGTTTVLLTQKLREH